MGLVIGELYRFMFKIPQRSFVEGVVKKINYNSEGYWDSCLITMKNSGRDMYIMKNQIMQY